VAQKVQTLFIDDIDGSAAEGTVRFGLDGASGWAARTTRSTSTPSVPGGPDPGFLAQLRRLWP
jgi:hypothetical protein